MSVPMDFTNMNDLSSDDSDDEDSAVESDDEEEGETMKKKMALREEEEEKEEEEEEENEDDENNDKNSDTIDDDDDDIDADDDDDDEDDLDEATAKAEISRLKGILTESPYHYDTHLALIKACKRSGDLTSLRTVRQNMAELFPLTSSLWLEWIDDERRMEADRASITALFEKAVVDYVSVDVWVEWCTFAIGAGDADVTRGIFERALSVVGLHVAKGRLVWEAYREFEMLTLSMLQPAPGAVVGDELRAKIDAQTKKLLKLFERQLCIPHSNMAATMSEYEEWLGKDGVSPAVKKAYIDAKKRSIELEKLEDALEEAATADDDDETAVEKADGAKTITSKSAIFKKYIEFEKSKESPARIQLIFERALSHAPLVADTWISYGDYLDRILKIPSKSLTLYERATRNCPWNAELWRRLLVSLERDEASKARMDPVYEKALSAGFANPTEYGVICFAYLDYMRRRCVVKKDERRVFVEDDEKLSLLRGAFEQAMDFLATLDGGDASFDQIARVAQYAARFEAKYCVNGMEAARKMWTERIFPLGYNANYNMQIEFINLERAYGSIKHCRRHFHKAIASTSQLDYPEALFDAFVTFEREEGSLEDAIDAVATVDKQRNFLAQREAKKAEKEAALAGKNKNATGDKKRPFVGGGGGGGGASEGKDVQKQNGQPARKKMREMEKSEDGKKQKTMDADIFKVPQLPSRTSPSSSSLSPATSSLKKTVQSEAPPTKPPPPSATDPAPIVDEALEKRDRTVFLSNMNYSATEDDLREAFKFCGAISSIRLVSDAKSGKPRGFGYVEFTEPKAAEAALKMDRYLVKDRPLYISKVKEKGSISEKKFQFSMGLEPRKLFVKNLPLVSDKIAVKTMFSSHGDVVDVRLVTMKSGKSKGMAYVEFATEEQAKKAMLQTDGMLVGENKIEVAISNTPQRRDAIVGEAATPSTATIAAAMGSTIDSAPHLGGGKKETAERGKARTQVTLVPRAATAKMMMPRSLKAKPATTPKPAPVATVATSGDAVKEPQGKGEDQMDVDNNEEEKVVGKKSNSDFRNMFFK